VKVSTVLTSHDRLGDKGMKTGEDELNERHALYSKGPNFSCYIQVDGTLVTGQNPALSGPAAEALLKVLRSTTTTRVVGA
jgi:putative intracellular protease/amidase